MTVEAICVDPATVAQIWPRVSGVIYAAMKRGGLGSFAAVEKSVLGGRMLLWLAVGRQDEKERIKAACVTALEQSEWHNARAIVACSGNDVHDWIGLLARIEDFARAEACDSVRIYGRVGWIRLLPDAYRIKRVVIERTL